MGLRRNAQRFGGFKPTSLPGCVLWLRADALSLNDGDPVGTWSDESGDGFHVTQATAAAQPTYYANRQASKAGVYFDGIDDLLSNTANLLAGGAARSVCAVADVENTHEGGTLVCWRTTTTVWPALAWTSAGTTYLYSDGVNGPSNHSLATELTTLRSPFCAVYRCAGTGEFLTWRLNGTAKTVSAAAGTTTEGGTVGFQVGQQYAGTAYPWKGDMYEIAVYNRSLTDAEAAQWEAYSRTKWATP